MHKIITIIATLILTQNVLFSTILKIYSNEDKKPISNALIIINDADTLKTNSDGTINLSNYKGNISFKVIANKFQAFATKFNVEQVPFENGTIYLNPKLFQLDEIMIYSASRQQQKITESPAAIYQQNPDQIRINARTGQIAQVFQSYTGIDVLQNGASDFIVNTRGFNGGLNRRVLVLQDGRDASMPLLGAQEWNSFSMPLDEFARVEFVRGPAASLYGANAFNGVLNLTSYAPKQILGAKASVLAGDYDTYRIDARYAGMWNFLSYKISLGTSNRLNWSNRRDSIQFLEYPGLPLERKTLKRDDRMTKSYYGTFRMDFDLWQDASIVSEFGYSRNTNELFVFGLGRTFVKDVERPYARLALNLPNFHFQTHYMQRRVLDTMWLMVPGAPLLDNSKDLFFEAQYNHQFSKSFGIIVGATQDFQFIRTSGTSIPNDVDANYTGIYSQFDYKTNYNIDFVTSARIDFASIHETQFSPRFAIVYKPVANHNLRISAGRSFQRPNYSELYRLTPDAPAIDPKSGKPVNFTTIQKLINDTLTILTGTNPNLNFGLNALNAKAIGNPNLKVERNIGLDFGYEGIFLEHIKLSVDLYYNKLNDFITNFLPRVNTDIPEWTPELPDNLKQYTNLVKDLVYTPLSPRDKLRLSNYQGKPTFVVSNTNIGEVIQYGMELNIIYLVDNNLSFEAGYSNYNFEVIKANQYQAILPNTSPNKYRLAANYTKKGLLDVRLDFSYTQGFDWLAGTYVGYVPDYALVNLNIGVYPIENLEVGLYVFNLLDRKHYQMFGGTYLPRYTTMKISYQI